MRFNIFSAQNATSSMLIVKIAAWAGAKAGAEVGVLKARKSGAKAGAKAGAEAGSDAGAKAGAEAAAIAAKKIATETLKRALTLANSTSNHVINIYGNGSVGQGVTGGAAAGGIAVSAGAGSAGAVSTGAGSAGAVSTGAITPGSSANPMEAGFSSLAGGTIKGKGVGSSMLNKAQTSSSAINFESHKQITAGIHTMSHASTLNKPAGVSSPGNLAMGTLVTPLGKPLLSVAGSYVEVLSNFASHSVRAANGSNPSVLARYFVDPQGMANKCKSNK